MIRPAETVGQQEERAIAELYKPLRRFAAVVAPRGVEPDDLVQEAFVRVLRSRRLGELESPQAYLRRTVLNLVISGARRARRQDAALARYVGSVATATEPSYPSDVAELLRLGSKARAVLFLHDIEGYEFDEVAVMLGMRGPAVRMLASRARRQLRTLLEEDADG